MKFIKFIAAAAVGLSLLVGPTSATAGIANPTVNSVAQLLAAIKTAQPGNIIRVAPGTYTRVIIVNANFSPSNPLVITASTASQLPVFVGFGVANSSGITFKNLEFTSVGSTDAYYAFRLSASHDLTFTHDDVHGDVNGVPGQQLMGFYLNLCSNITFSDSNFHHINLPILATKSSGVTITNNTIAYVNKSGLQFGQTSNVDIENNLFTNFVITPGTHPDVIQFYTAGTTAPASNITISNNLFARGRGAAAQGIFIQDETGQLPYHGLTVSNNAMIGGMWNAIYLRNVGSDTHVYNNVAATWSGNDVSSQKPGLFASFVSAPVTNFIGWIFVSGDAANQSGVLMGNKAQAYLDPQGHQTKVPSGNTLLGPVTDQGSSLISSFQGSHRIGSSISNPVLN